MVDGNGSTASELRDQLELAQAIAHMGSWHWDLATGVVTWSDELYRIYGLAPRSRDITFEFFMSCIVSSERQRIQREIEQALQHHGRFAYRELITRPTGEVRTLDTIGEVSVRDGVVTGLMGTCRDITDEARSAERLTFYGEVFEHAMVCLSAWQLDTRNDPAKLRLVAFNNATEQLAGASLSAKMGQPMLEIFPSVGRTSLIPLARAIHDGAPIRHVESFQLDEAPGAPFVTATLFALPNQGIGLALQDVTSQRRAEILQTAERRALEMLASNAPISDILTVIVEAIEDVSIDTIASILLLDESGTRLRHGAAPHLPNEVNALIDGLVVSPSNGSCGTAVYRREPVYATDIATDPLWGQYRDIARTYHLGSCWSTPIMSNAGHVLGTFALYHSQPRIPDDAARDLITRATHVASIVLGRRALDEQLRALTARVEAVREEERTTIARDIHDQLGQALTALKLDLGWLARRVDNPPIDRKLVEMARATDELIEAVRKIASDLRPGVLDGIGLCAAVEWQAEEFQARSGTTCVVKCEIGELQLERSLLTAVFRIFQEALTNITRHANATKVDVTIALDHGRIRMDVADDGVGLPDINPRNSSLGILGMTERARRLGGECTVRSGASRGTIVTVVIPLRFPAEQHAEL
ncbi:MAG: GAF domain-containing protein [Deltaproteobacteria bacterium]